MTQSGHADPLTAAPLIVLDTPVRTDSAGCLQSQPRHDMWREARWHIECEPFLRAEKNSEALRRGALCKALSVMPFQQSR